MKKKKFSKETKMEAVMCYLAGGKNMCTVAAMFQVEPSAFQRWVRNYQSMGPQAFDSLRHVVYSQELKTAAVEEYLSGGVSQNQICKKFQIKSTDQLRRWVLRYNGHEIPKNTKRGRKKSMTKGRKTTCEERVQIVSWHFEQGASYEETAEKFQISYQQIYSWVKKYQEKGTDGLMDRRGKAKPVDEQSELEQLRAENRLLKAENRYREVENLYLKKVKEIERRR